MHGYFICSSHSFYMTLYCFGKRGLGLLKRDHLDMASVKLLRFSASHQSFQIESTLFKIHHMVQDCVHVCRGTVFLKITLL